MAGVKINSSDVNFNSTHHSSWPLNDFTSGNTINSFLIKAKNSFRHRGDVTSVICCVEQLKIEKLKN
jgi:hypothetical protein